VARFSLHVDKPKAVVTIYNPKASPPGPLENLQGVPADREKVGTFLRRLCKKTQEVCDDWNAAPLNVDVSQKKLNAAAKAICENFLMALLYCVVLWMRVAVNKNSMSSRNTGERPATSWKMPSAQTSLNVSTNC
jgi:hypothetical protein